MSFGGLAWLNSALSVCSLCPGTNRYFQRVITNFNIETSFVDATDASNVEKAIQSNTKVYANLTDCNSHD